MIKHLLFFSSLLIPLVIKTQTRVVQHVAGIFDQQEIKFREFQSIENDYSNIRLMTKVPELFAKPSGQPVTAVSWSLLCGSMNVEGMLSSASQPLQYNPVLNAVSFVHQKSDTYTTTSVVSPSAQPGVVVAELSTNWGASWDSTAVWANNNEWGRFPQGAIYNPISSTVLANAYIVTSGATVGQSGMTGNFYASKSLNGFNTTPSGVSGAQQFYSFGLSSYPSGQAAHNWSRSGFTYTDDGIMRSVGIVQSNYSNVKSIQGFAVATGTFNGSTFDWKVDVLMPPCMVSNTGIKHLLPDPRMTFNQAGTIGYLVGIGVTSYANFSNKGYQPIIYKMDRTTNANATWTLMPSINFNSPGFLPLVKSSYQATRGLAGIYTNGIDTLGVPFFEDYDVVVDNNNLLHIAATIMSTASDHPDSLQYAAQFTTSINPTEKYRWRHAPGSRPYLYDFLGNGLTPYTVFTLDSLSSESPGSFPGEAGYSENFWDSVGTSGYKPAINSRIQLGRSNGGSPIIYSWAESDSAITHNQFKWNTFPNVKVRVLLQPTSAPGTTVYYTNSNHEQDITKGHYNVFTRGTFHFMSPLSSMATVSSTGWLNMQSQVRIPFTVTNSSPYSQNTNNTTWYGDANLTFTFNTSIACGGPTDYTPPVVGFKEDIADLNFVLHPNPVKDELSLSVETISESDMKIHICNGLGQNVAVFSRRIKSGKNVIHVDLKDLSSGMYFLTAEKNGTRTIKKFLKE